MAEITHYVNGNLAVLASDAGDRDSLSRFIEL